MRLRPRPGPGPGSGARGWGLGAPPLPAKAALRAQTPRDHPYTSSGLGRGATPLPGPVQGGSSATHPPLLSLRPRLHPGPDRARAALRAGQGSVLGARPPPARPRCARSPPATILKRPRGWAAGLRLYPGPVQGSSSATPPPLPALLSLRRAFAQAQTGPGLRPDWAGLGLGLGHGPAPLLTRPKPGLGRRVARAAPRLGPGCAQGCAGLGAGGTAPAPQRPRCARRPPRPSVHVLGVRPRGCASTRPGPGQLWRGPPPVPGQARAGKGGDLGCAKPQPGSGRARAGLGAGRARAVARARLQARPGSRARARAGQHSGLGLGAGQGSRLGGTQGRRRSWGWGGPSPRKAALRAQTPRDLPYASSGLGRGATPLPGPVQGSSGAGLLPSQARRALGREEIWLRRPQPWLGLCSGLRRARPGLRCGPGSRARGRAGAAFGLGAGQGRAGLRTGRGLGAGSGQGSARGLGRAGLKAGRDSRLGGTQGWRRAAALPGARSSCSPRSGELTDRQEWVRLISCEGEVGSPEAVEYATLGAERDDHL
jgi:hypothetical protein